MASYLNSSQATSSNAGMRDKTSQQLKSIARNTQKNLEEGVFKNPNLTSLNHLGLISQISAAQTPVYRASSLGMRNVGRLGANNSASGLDGYAGDGFEMTEPFIQNIMLQPHQASGATIGSGMLHQPSHSVFESNENLY
jgi:hypothetical protein